MPPNSLICATRIDAIPRSRRWRGAAVSNIEQSVAERDGDSLSAIDGAELAHCGLSVLIDCSLADGKDRPDLPRRFSLRRPGWDLTFARRERRLDFRLPPEQLAHPLEGVERHEVKAGLCVCREI